VNDETAERRVPRHVPDYRPYDLLPGVELEMGGKTWIVPPLTLGQLRRLGAKVEVMSADKSMLDPEVVDAVVAVVTAALKRNYPAIDEDQVADMLDMGNAPSVFVAVLTGSGLKRGSGDSGPFGGAGATSTVSSPQPSDTGPAT
jgi:hypothetical protein